MSFRIRAIALPENSIECKGVPHKSNKNRAAAQKGFACSMRFELLPGGARLETRLSFPIERRWGWLPC